jgi:retinol dehydrogenase-11
MNSMRASKDLSDFDSKLQAPPAEPEPEAPTALKVLNSLKIDLTGKVAVVTGGNSGIGFETVKALASARCKVILACRDLRAGQAAKEELYRWRPVAAFMDRVSIEVLDLSDLASVKDFAGRVDEVDLLILNAGTMSLEQKEFTVDGFEKHMGVNHFGHAYLTRLLQPKLRGTAEAPSRVVVVASSAHSMASKDWTAENLDLDFETIELSPWDAYCHSKLANILFAKGLAKRLPETVAAVSLHPGLIETTSSGGILGFLEDKFVANQTLPQAAATTVWAAVTPAIAEIRGEYLDNCAVATNLSDQGKDDELADAFWDATEARLDAALVERGLMRPVPESNDRGGIYVYT